MLSTQAVLKYEKNNKSFSFACAPDAAIEDVQEALREFHAYTQRIVEANKPKSEEVTSIPNTEETL